MACGFDARAEHMWEASQGGGGERSGKGELRGPDPNPCKTQGFPRPGPDQDTPSRHTHIPMTLVSRMVLNLISQQCPIKWEVQG